MDQLGLSNIESPHDLMISHSIVVLIIVLILFKTLLVCFYNKCSGEHLEVPKWELVLPTSYMISMILRGT
ncbi:hypothetical protein HanRHA438_Chr11g0527271 [Helianthus annuus]|nr:hypothetical protein HanRHA438_Chr11g0527271 [Helianthus annuus]